MGCLKDLIINGADIDIVAYAHEQNSGGWHVKILKYYPKKEKNSAILFFKDQYEHPVTQCSAGVTIDPVFMVEIV